MKQFKIQFDFSKCHSTTDKVNIIETTLSKPRYLYETLPAAIEKLMVQIDQSPASSKLPEEYADFEDFVIAFSDLISFKNLFDGKEDDNFEFEKAVEVLDDILPPDFLYRLQNTYPIKQELLEKESAETRITVAALILLLQNASTNLDFPAWFGMTIAGNSWHNQSSEKNSGILTLGAFEGQWAVLSQKKVFKLYSSPSVTFRMSKTDLSRSGNHVRIYRENGQIGVRLQYASEYQKNCWILKENRFSDLLTLLCTKPSITCSSCIKGISFTGRLLHLKCNFFVTFKKKFGTIGEINICDLFNKSLCS